MSKLIVANWKSNHNLQSALQWLKQVGIFLQDQHGLEEFNELSIVLAPPYPLLPVLGEFTQALNMKLAVQDLSQFGAGSYTGAVCVENLQNLEIDFSILGHSERRQHFQETDEIIAQKVALSLQAGINPILCVDKPYLMSQMSALEKFFTPAEIEGLLIMAYEPLAAIGSGQSEDLNEVKLVIQEIQKVLPESPVLYGGSVDETNVAQFLTIADGVLVGGAALEAKRFIRLLEAIIR